MPFPAPRTRLAPLAWAVAAALVPAAAGAAGGSVRALADLSLEDLMNVEVVSANRKAQSLQHTAAAVHVITHDDILRSGVRTLPEALRLAPGVDVAQLSSSRWAVGVRGDAGRFSNKLQVLVDGRSVYSAHYSGVFWEAEHLPLEDIDRIEVIRGPAGAVWGANAVNGVINIITRQALRTDGTASSVSVGSDGLRTVNLRHSRGAGADGAMRLYAQQVSTQGFEPSEAQVRAAGPGIQDDSRHTVAGARYDRIEADGQRLSVHGNLSRSTVHDTWRLPDLTAAPAYMASLPMTQTIRTSTLGATLDRPLDARSSVHAQISAQDTRADQTGFGVYDSHQVDLDARHRWQGRDHDFTWGAGFRWYRDHTEGSPYLSFDPDRRSLHAWRVFAQDEWALSPEWLATAGLRVDHNPYTGSEPQPNARLLWKIDAQSAAWAAASRAVRVPSRGERDATVNAHAQALPDGRPLLVLNGKDSGSVVETVNAIEFGWRRQLRHDLAVDVAAFDQRYDPLSVLIEQPTIDMNTIASPVVVASLNNRGATVRTRGLELASDWRVAPQWRSRLHVGYLDVTTAPAPGESAALFRSPQWIAMLRESWDVSPTLTVDAALRHTSARPDPSGLGQGSPSRTALDVNLRWQASPALTVAATGHNLGPKRQQEIASDLGFSVPTQAERAVVLKAELKF